MLIDLSSSQLARGSSLTTKQLESGLTDSGYEFNLIESEYKGLGKTGTFVYKATFYDEHNDKYEATLHDEHNGKPVSTVNVYVNFINERLYEVDV